MKSFLRFPGSGLVTSSAAERGGRHPLPVPAAAAPRRARGSPMHSCGSEHRPPASHLRKDFMILTRFKWKLFNALRVNRRCPRKVSAAVKACLEYHQANSGKNTVKGYQFVLGRFQEEFVKCKGVKFPFDVWPKKWVYAIMSRKTYNVKRRLDPFMVRFSLAMSFLGAKKN